MRPSERECTQTRARLALLPGDDLNAAEARAAREHLTGCRACQRALGDQLQARSFLRELSPERQTLPSEPFFQSLKEQVLHRVALEPRVQTGPSRVAQVMTLAALLLLAIYMWPFGDDGRVEMPEPAPGGAAGVDYRHDLPVMGLRGRQEALRAMELGDGELELGDGELGPGERDR